MKNEVVVCHLQEAAYQPTWDLQRSIQSKLIERKRAGEDGPHVILTVEHPPVYTLGKSGDAGNLLANENELSEMGATFVKIDRGGDITYHGPGQLVVYPILDLEKIFTDIVKYLRVLEQAVIDTLAGWEIETDRIDGRTGVWVVPDERGPERKICAMGIKCSRWVTMHGLALNVGTDLSFFDRIIPCGISDRGVTTMEQELSRSIQITDVREQLVGAILDQFSLDAADLSGSTASAYLTDVLGVDPAKIEALHSF